jgi:hypothetical protein
MEADKTGQNVAKPDQVVPIATQAGESKTTMQNQGATNLNAATSEINPTPSSLFSQMTATHSTAVLEGTKPPANNEAGVVRQKPNTNTTTPTGDGAAATHPKQDNVDNEKSQPKVTYSEENTFDPRVPPKAPPTLPTVIKMTIDENNKLSGDEKHDSNTPGDIPLPQGKSPETPAKDFPEMFNQPTAVPTSSAENVVPTAADGENITQKAKWKSYGILKGFWRFHEVLGEKIIHWGQPLKGALRGILSFVGLGQVGIYIDNVRDKNERNGNEKKRITEWTVSLMNTRILFQNLFLIQTFRLLRVPRQ